MTFVKSAPKNIFSQKTIFLIENFPEQKSKIFGFLGNGHMYIFEISLKRRIFWKPLST